VVGYTDSSPVSRANKQFDSNRSLSAARALTVAGLLKQSLSDPQRRVEVTGKGELDLILDARGREDADRSRRVEILLLKAG
jgi:type VI secretion system protein ImpK